MRQKSSFVREYGCGILICSDRAASGERPDQSIPRLDRWARDHGFEIRRREILPDDRDRIAEILRSWIEQEIELIIVSGGTGLGPRDVTPEAILDVIDRRVPGMEEAMRRASLDVTPHAMISRAVVGARLRSLVVSVPGNPQGAVENLDVVAPALAHALELLRGEEPDA
jgi:molybdopterin adenylyltransferase